MPAFGDRSKRRLEGVHPLLRRVLDEAIRHVDFTIVCGWRGEEDQNAAFEAGKSTLKYPASKHNNVATEADVQAGHAPNAGAPLSLAVDIAPWHADRTPHVRWDLPEEFYLYAGILRGLGLAVLPDGWELRLGADWDLDGQIADQRFFDLGHIELVRR